MLLTFCVSNFGAVEIHQDFTRTQFWLQKFLHIWKDPEKCFQRPVLRFFGEVLVILAHSCYVSACREDTQIDLVTAIVNEIEWRSGDTEYYPIRSMVGYHSCVYLQTPQRSKDSGTNIRSCKNKNQFGPSSCNWKFRWMQIHYEFDSSSINRL